MCLAQYNAIRSEISDEHLDEEMNETTEDPTMVENVPEEQLDYGLSEEQIESSIMAMVDEIFPADNWFFEAINYDTNDENVVYALPSFPKTDLFVSDINFFLTHNIYGKSSLEIRSIIFRNRISFLRYIPDQTHEICISALFQDAWALRLIRRQTHNLCKFAVLRDPSALQFVRQQTISVCFTAIMIEPASIQYVHDQTTLVLHLVGLATGLKLI